MCFLSSLSSLRLPNRNAKLCASAESRRTSDLAYTCFSYFWPIAPARCYTITIWEPLEQFCGPPVSRNITLHLLYIVERLSCFNDLCGCSITSHVCCSYFYFTRISQLWLCVITLRASEKAEGNGCALLTTPPPHTPSLTEHGPSRNRVLRPG